MDEYSQRMRIDLTKFLSQHQGTILAYAMSITRDMTVAEDVAQEVALVVATQWEELPHERALPWLLETTRRKALESLRRWKPHRATLDPDVLAAIGEDFTQDFARDSHNRALDACLDKLSGDARGVVHDRYWRDLSCEEIAARIGRSVKSVYGILMRSRLALATCVERQAARHL